MCGADDCLNCHPEGECQETNDSTTSETQNIMIHTPIKIAEVLYTSYCQAVGGVAHNGDLLPPWVVFCADPSKSRQSEAWIKAATDAIPYFTDPGTDEKKITAILKPRLEKMIKEKNEPYFRPAINAELAALEAKA